MALTNVSLAEEALSLPPEQRQQLAELLLQSLKTDGRTDQELNAMLRLRLSVLETGKVSLSRLISRAKWIGATDEHEHCSGR